MPSVKVPKIVSDLYGDLRDRHLLPLVVVLIAAMIGAPILLNKHSDGEEPAAPAVASGSRVDDADAAFTVVPAKTELRSPSKRLGHRRALNPFRQPKSPTSVEGSEGVSSAASSDAESTVEGVPVHPTSERGAESPSPVEAPVSEGSTTPEVVSPAPAKEGAAKTESHTETEVVVQNQTVGYEIEAEAGFVPHTSLHKSIAPMTKLPNKKHPVILFMGLSKDNKRALFLMTSGVTAYYGGRCALDKEACQLLELKPGKSITFAYGYGKTKYKLHLDRIVPVVKTSQDKGSVTKTTTETRTKHRADPDTSPKGPAPR